jgi:hypothetical protein
VLYLRGVHQVCPFLNDDESVHAALAAVEAVISRFLEANNPTPDDPGASSTRVNKLQAQLQGFQQPSDQREEAIASIRRSPDEQTSDRDDFERLTRGI